MKKIYTYSLLFCSLVCLTACPYKEIYKTVSDEATIQGIKVQPKEVFYHSHKKISTLTVGFTISNQGDSTQNLVLSKSYLNNSANTLLVNKIYLIGDSFPPNHIFTLPPKHFGLLALGFKDSTQKFGDTVKVSFNVSGVSSNLFSYVRIN